VAAAYVCLFPDHGRASAAAAAAAGWPEIAARALVDLVRDALPVLFALIS
jgi:hypothetical protein